MASGIPSDADRRFVSSIEPPPATIIYRTRTQWSIQIDQHDAVTCWRDDGPRMSKHPQSNRSLYCVNTSLGYFIFDALPDHGALYLPLDATGKTRPTHPICAIPSLGTFNAIRRVRPRTTLRQLVSDNSLTIPVSSDLFRYDVQHRFIYTADEAEQLHQLRSNAQRGAEAVSTTRLALGESNVLLGPGGQVPIQAVAADVISCQRWPGVAVALNSRSSSRSLSSTSRGSSRRGQSEPGLQQNTSSRIPATGTGKGSDSAEIRRNHFSRSVPSRSGSGHSEARHRTRRRRRTLQPYANSVDDFSGSDKDWVQRSVPSVALSGSSYDSRDRFPPRHTRGTNGDRRPHSESQYTLGRSGEHARESLTTLNRGHGRELRHSRTRSGGDGRLDTRYGPETYRKSDFAAKFGGQVESGGQVEFRGRMRDLGHDLTRSTRSRSRSRHSAYSGRSTSSDTAYKYSGISTSKTFWKSVGRIAVEALNLIGKTPGGGSVVFGQHVPLDFY